MFLGSIFTKTRVIGKHYLPEKGPYIIAANHFNVFDPPLVIYAIQKPISFLAASETWHFGYTVLFQQTDQI